MAVGNASGGHSSVAMKHVMGWHKTKNQEHEKQTKRRVASHSEIKATFKNERDYLFWIALLITGDAKAAKQSVANASALSLAGPGVLHDWLVRWVRSATVRFAVYAVRDLIAASKSRYADWNCPHGEHAVFSIEQIRSLREADPQDIISALDPLARSVLIARGVQHASVSESASLLNLSCKCVIGAHCYLCRIVQFPARDQIYNPFAPVPKPNLREVQEP